MTRQDAIAMFFVASLLMTSLSAAVGQTAPGPRMPQRAATAAGASSIIPPAASTAGAAAPSDAAAADGGAADGTVPTGELHQLGSCTSDAGLQPNVKTCSGSGTLQRPGESAWYRFNVLDAASAPAEATAFSLHLRAAVTNGRVRMGLWLPGAPLIGEPSITGEMLLSSTFAQEQYITLPATQLYNSPGLYWLQIMNDYGAPSYSLQADITPATTLLADPDREALRTLVTDCCPSTSSGTCATLETALASTSIDGDICHTGAVQCDLDGHVTDLVLQGSNGDGDLTCPDLSTGIAALPRLNRLDLAGATLGADTATIARALSPAVGLRWLVLRSAGIQGDLSCDLLLPSLQLLSLTRNGLTGSIPECYTATKTLRHLYLSDNALMGPLPEFHADSSLQLLFAREQRGPDGSPSALGPLPASLATAESLELLQLSNVGLTGSLPPLPARLTYLNVSDNGLTGALPELPATLVSFDVSYNSLTGGLPQDMSHMSSLVDIQVSGNSLMGGSLPRGLPPGLVQLSAAGNGLSGGVPQLPNGLRYLSLAANQLEGRLPDGTAAEGLWIADLSSNALTGPVPAALTTAPSLVYLNISGNYLEGFSDAQGWNTPELVTLDASFNLIDGGLPASLAKQPRLAYINLGSNMLSGGFEPFASALELHTPVGAVFDVSNNHLTGPLSDELSRLAAFSAAPPAFPAWTANTSVPLSKVFNVANNSLSGVMPTFLTQGLARLSGGFCSAIPGACSLVLRVNGGGNRLSCPPPLVGASSAPAVTEPTVEELAAHGTGGAGSGGVAGGIALLEREGVTCLDAAGQEMLLASVLRGAPVASGAAGGNSSLPHTLQRTPRPAGDVAVARERRDRRRSSRQQLAPAAIAGIVVGAVVAAATIAAVGYMVVYRRWWTVRVSTSFKRMPEGALAAAGTTAAASGTLPHLPEPPARSASVGGAAPLGGDDRV